MALEKKVGNKVVLANMFSNLGLHDKPGQPPTTPLSNIRGSELNRRGPPSVLQGPNKGHLNDSWRRPEGSKAREGSRVPGGKRAPGLEATPEGQRIPIQEPTTKSTPLKNIRKALYSALRSTSPNTTRTSKRP